MSLRPYQAEAKAAVLGAWETARSTLLVLPTGTGKTYTAGEILRERAQHGRILWLAHRSELLEQADKTLSGRIGLTCEVEKAESWAATGSGLFGAAPVVVGSVQTMRGRRLQRWPASAFATIVVDEAHHAAARGYRDILQHFPGAKVLGLTATPDRGDGVGLGAVFESVAFEYDIRTAIQQGYLCPVVQRSIVCADLDVSDVKTVAGDLAQGELERRLRVDAVLHQIAAPLVEQAASRPTIVFTAGVAQAHALVDVIAGYAGPESAAAIDGTTPDEIRRERLDAFQEGRLQFLVNCAVLTEGFDAPHTACVAMARPTKSRALYAQCLGRGLRIADGKADCLALDFVGNSGRHQLVGPLDILGGKSIPAPVAKRAAELAAEGKPSEEALQQAEAEAIERERRAEERRRREAKIRAQVTYHARKVDPFAVHASAPGPRATDRQLEFLRGRGVTLHGTPSRAEASKMIDRVQERQRKNLCTIKQARLLAKYNLRTDVGFADAREIIDGIAANRWLVTPAMLERWGANADAAE